MRIRHTTPPPSRTAIYEQMVDRRGPDECWPWKGSRSKKNYGQFYAGDRKTTGAHRFGFAALIRPLETGETVDHLCHNRDASCPGGNMCEHRACQNPAHWEACSNWINGSRGRSFSAVNARKTHCDRGHELTPDNSYGYKGRRQCKKCAREDAKARAHDPAVKALRRERYKAAREAGMSAKEAARQRSRH